MKSLFSQKVIAVSLLGALLLLRTNAEAQGNPARKGFLGIATYAAMNPKFPCGKAIRALRRGGGDAIQVLYGTFGQDFSCLNRFTQIFHGIPHLVSIHLSNEVCRRNRTCAKNELSYRIHKSKYSKLLERGNIKILESYAQRVDSTLSKLERNDNTILLFTTGLEDNYSTKAYKKLSSFLKNKYESEKILFSRSPMRRISTNGDITQFHGPRLGMAKPIDLRRVYNLDSVHLLGYGGLNEKQTLQWLNSHKGAFARFIWAARWQGYKRPFVPPLKRTFKFTSFDDKVIPRLLKKAL